ncbi:UNVERIFIED_CONTAM: hypothetical protein FKN15_047170 [Acipenser sinensis]
MYSQGSTVISRHGTKACLFEAGFIGHCFNIEERYAKFTKKQKLGTQIKKQSIKQASRAQILDKATEYIQYMRRKNHTHQQDIDDLKRQNALLEQQVRALEKAKGNTQLQANYSSSDSSLYTNPKGSAVSAFDGGSDSSSESEPEEPQTRKKPRVEANQNHPARQ